MNYSKKSTKQIKAKLKIEFSKYIRKRDSFNGDGKGGCCISCGRPVSGKHWQCGHFYEAGKYKSLMFDEDNSNGQCLQCNYYKSANLHEYRKNLIKKIGEKRVLDMDLKASIEKQKGSYKWDRMSLIVRLEEINDKLKGAKGADGSGD